MNEMKSLVYLAGALAACGMIVGCTSTKTQAPVKKGKLALMSDRGVIPSPYRTPQIVPVSTAAAPRQTVSSVDEPRDDEPQAVEGDKEPLFVAADSGQPEATSTPYQSDYAKPEDASPKAGGEKAAPKPNVPKRTYKVVKGDTLTDIGYMYQISWRDLAAENNLTEKSILREGQTLVLPDSAAETPRPRQVRKAAPKPAPAVKNTPAAKGTPVAKPAAGGAAKPAAKKDYESLPADGIYTVVERDNLWVICHRFGLKGDDVRALNPTVNFQNLQIGQKIKLSGKQSGNGVAVAKAAIKDDTPKPLTPPAASLPPIPEEPNTPKPLTPPAAQKPLVPPTPPATDAAAPEAPAAEEAAPEAPATIKVTVPTVPKFDDLNPGEPQQPANNAEEPPLP